MNQKYFITQNKIKEIIKTYGGFRKYKYHPRAHSNFNNINLCEKVNENLWLCLHECGDYVMVTKCNEKGLIVYREYI